MIDTPLGQELITMIIDDEVIVFFLVMSVESQNISHDEIMTIIAARPNSNLELRILVLSRP